MNARADRRMAFAVLAGSIALSAAVVACSLPEAATAAAADPVTEPRVCAAAAVYRLATEDDWGQRAVIANAVLNQYAGGGPDCRPALVAALANDFSEHRWQSALDAVEAVASGSYSLPPACIRANRVTPLPDAVGPALHCVMGGLAFTEVQS